MGQVRDAVPRPSDGEKRGSYPYLLGDFWGGTIAKKGAGSDLMELSGQF